MLTGPIFSQEEEDEMMMDFDRAAMSPRASQTMSRGTVILDGEDDEEDVGILQQTAVEQRNEGTAVHTTFPHAIPHHEYNSEELQFSFDFSAPTDVDSIQFRHNDNDESSNKDRMSRVKGFVKKNCWMALGLAVAVYMGQQVMTVKNDLAAMRMENEQLRFTVETLQQQATVQAETASSQPQQDTTTSMSILDSVVLTTERIREYIEEELLGPDVLEGNHCKLKKQIIERANRAKEQVSRQVSELKHSFWETTERVGELIEEGLEELLAPHKQQKGNESDSIHFISSYVENVVDQWVDKKRIMETVDKTVKHISGSATKVLIPLLLVSGTSLLVDHFASSQESRS